MKAGELEQLLQEFNDGVQAARLAYTELPTSTGVRDTQTRVCARGTCTRRTTSFTGFCTKHRTPQEAS